MLLPGIPPHHHLLRPQMTVNIQACVAVSPPVSTPLLSLWLPRLKMISRPKMVLPMPIPFHMSAWNHFKDLSSICRCRENDFTIAGSKLDSTLHCNLIQF